MEYRFGGFEYSYILIGLAFGYFIGSFFNKKPKEKNRDEEAEDNGDCVICYEKKNTKKLSCGHPVHLNCLLKWDSQGFICPYCKQEIKLGIQERILFTQFKKFNMTVSTLIKNQEQMHQFIDSL